MTPLGAKQPKLCCTSELSPDIQQLSWLSSYFLSSPPLTGIRQYSHQWPGPLGSLQNEYLQSLHQKWIWQEGSFHGEHFSHCWETLPCILKASFLHVVLINQSVTKMAAILYKYSQEPEASNNWSFWACRWGTLAQTNRGIMCMTCLIYPIR